MEDIRNLKRQIQSASGEHKAQLVLKNAQVVNVFTEVIEQADVAICDGYIVGIGTYEGEQEIDLGGKYVCPGFLDGHIHLESSMLSPAEFQKAVLPHGTTGVITDPHEISNVAGTEGIDFMLEETESLTLDVWVLLPSCVPSTSLDEAGAILHAEDLAKYYNHNRVLGLAELMNSYGTIRTDPEILDKLSDARKQDKIIDGHAPGISGKNLNAYVSAGVMADHECSSIHEALEKLSRGQRIMIREGTAAQNLEALMPLCQAPYYHRCMFVTDDKHPGDIIHLGHMDYIIRKAIELGADPIVAIKMASLHPAQFFGLKRQGAVAPGYQADLVVLTDLSKVTVSQVYKSGRLVAENGKTIVLNSEATKRKDSSYSKVHQSFHLKEITKEDLHLNKQGEQIRVLCLTPKELLTTERHVKWNELPGCAPGVNLEEDVIKMAVLERHHDTGHIGLGFLGGYGLKAGAVATSVAHDSHNLIVAGVTDEDMVLAANTVRMNQGGLAVVRDGKVLGMLKLPIAGLMSYESANDVEEQLENLKELTKELGIPERIDAFMTLAFASLPVIPKLRLNTYGLIDTEKQQVIEVTF